MNIGKGIRLGVILFVVILTYAAWPRHQNNTLYVLDDNSKIVSIKLK